MNNSQFVSLNKFSKSGGFLQKFPLYELSDNSNSSNFKEYKELKVNNLTDDELADNWQLKLPKKLFVKSMDSNKKITVKRVKNFHTFNINMSELPYHLMGKLTPKFENNILTSYEATDNIYKYRIMATDMDDRILRLAKMLNSYKVDSNEVKQCVVEMEKNNMKGWVLKKAKKYLSKL